MDKEIGIKIEELKKSYYDEIKDKIYEFLKKHKDKAFNRKEINKELFDNYYADITLYSYMYSLKNSLIDIKYRDIKSKRCGDTTYYYYEPSEEQINHDIQNSNKKS